jgi:hypothetical protein
MKYNARIRRRRAPPAEMRGIHTETIREAAEVVRARYGFDTDDPHKGFLIKEAQSLPTKVIE